MGDITTTKKATIINANDLGQDVEEIMKSLGIKKPLYLVSKEKYGNMYKYIKNSLITMFGVGYMLTPNMISSQEQPYVQDTIDNYITTEDRIGK